MLRCSVMFDADNNPTFDAAQAVNEDKERQLDDKHGCFAPDDGLCQRGAPWTMFVAEVNRSMSAANDITPHDRAADDGGAG